MSGNNEFLDALEKMEHGGIVGIMEYEGERQCFSAGFTEKTTPEDLKDIYGDIGAHFFLKRKYEDRGPSHFEGEI